MVWKVGSRVGGGGLSKIEWSHSECPTPGLKIYRHIFDEFTICSLCQPFLFYILVWALYNILLLVCKYYKIWNHKGVVYRWLLLITAKPLHDSDTVSVHFNHFYWMGICDKLSRHLYMLIYIYLNVDECWLISSMT